VEVVEEHRRREIAAAFRAALPHMIPILASVPLLGVAYGVLMHTHGYGALWSTLMSAIAFCGSMQFAAIPMLVTGFMPFQAFVLSFLVNARHLFYGISMLERYRGMGRAKLFLVYLLCDETFSICCTVNPPADVRRKDFFIWVSLLMYLLWVGGTFFGGFLGNFITFDTTGLDFTLTALFIVLFTEQCRERRNRPAAAIGVGCSVVCLLLFGPQRFIIPAMALMLVLLMAGRRRAWF
jgi:4-azaleucine resistance transporter AzlC